MALPLTHEPDSARLTFACDGAAVFGPFEDGHVAHASTLSRSASALVMTV